MTENNKKNKRNFRVIIKKNKTGGPAPERNQFVMNAIITVLLFLALTTLYSLFQGEGDKTAQIPISELSADINKGSVSSILINGDGLEVTYSNGDIKSSKKEEGTAL